MKKKILTTIKKYWNSLESKYPVPTYVTKIKEIEFKALKDILDNKKEHKVKQLIRDMYIKKYAFILRNASNSSLKDTIIKLSSKYDKKKPSFHKMYDGTPNFHRFIDKKITKKYSVYAIKHSYFFYNWNIKTPLEKKFKDEVYRHWRYVKFIAGNSKKAFENNIPSMSQVDRLQIIKYPLGGGELRDHVDPRKNQRIVSGLIMSKKGEDFNSGGFYFRGRNRQKVNIENKLKIGDSVMFYGSIVHGVDKVDPNKKLNWKSKKARWFIGMFVNDSDHVKDRLTAKDLTKSVSVVR